jgi:hypothetical protein
MGELFTPERLGFLMDSFTYVQRRPLGSTRATTPQARLPDPDHENKISLAPLRLQDLLKSMHKQLASANVLQ